MILEITIKTRDGKTIKYNSQAAAIRKAREDAGISQAEAADRVGIKVQAWQQYEYGTRTPKDSMLEKIAVALGVDISVLTTFSGQV